MKFFLTLTCGLALASFAGAAQQDDNNQHKKKGGEQSGQQTAVVKPGKQRGPSVGVQSNNPVLTGKHQKQLLRGQNNTLPAVQSNPHVLSNTHVQSNAQLNAGKGKFHAKQFQTKNGPAPGIDSEKFQEGKHIKGSEKWEGKKYAAFKAYKAEKHEKEWWEHHHNRIILIGGGWYFWNEGYWCPAWGYDDRYSYYPYDGPIYAANDLPPDQVIANVQSALQEQGYYQGEVDGLLGPLTRAALAQYQADHGLYTTAAIDEPTLASLGMV